MLEDQHHHLARLQPSGDIGRGIAGSALHQRPKGQGPVRLLRNQQGDGWPVGRFG